MAVPTDGYGIYDSRQVNDSTNPTRLAKIASLGMSLVLNYGILYGHLSDITSYINTAHSNGLKVIVSLADPVIWDGSTNISTKYPSIIGDWGGSGTDYAGFTTWLVSQLKGLSGVWGWYVGDEVSNANHALLLTHAQVIRAADSAHPRLYIGSGTATATSFGSGNSIFGDVADIIGDDFYPIGVSEGAAGQPTFANEYKGIQTYANAHALQSAVVLQAWSYQQSNTDNSLSFWPAEAPYIYREQMRQLRDTAIANMTPRLILWYEFPYLYDSSLAPDYTRQLADFAWASSGIGAADPVISRDNFLRIQASGWNPSSNGESWSNPSNFVLSCYSYYGSIGIPGSAQSGYLLLGSGTCYNPNFLYRWFNVHNTDEVGPILRYTSGTNLVRVEISNNVMVIARYVNGVRTYVSSTVTTVPIVGSTAYWTRVTSNARTYTVKLWTDGTVEPGSPQLTWTDTNYTAVAGQYGIFAFVNSNIHNVYVNSFEVYLSSINTAYYVAPNGNDSNTGTQSQPFFSIQQALNTVNPGDTIYIEPGVFLPASLTYPITATSIEPITIWSYTAFPTALQAVSTQNYVYNRFAAITVTVTGRDNIVSTRGRA